MQPQTYSGDEIGRVTHDQNAVYDYVTHLESLISNRFDGLKIAIDCANGCTCTTAQELFTRLGGGSVFLIYTIITWASVAISAFIDNIPYVATMLPVVQSIAMRMGVDPTVLYFGLLSGATLGGNLTPIGASAISGSSMARESDASRISIKNKGVPDEKPSALPRLRAARRKGETV